jgi:hypothetical protein
MKISTPDQETLVVSAFPWGYWLFGLFFWVVSVILVQSALSSYRSTCKLMSSGKANCHIATTLFGIPLHTVQVTGVRQITIGHTAPDSDGDKSYYIALWTTKGVHKLPGNISLSRHRKTGERFLAWRKRRSSSTFVFERPPNWWAILAIFGCVACGFVFLKERWRRVVFDARMHRCQIRSWGLFGRDNRKIDFSAIERVWSQAVDEGDSVSYALVLTVGDEELQISNNTGKHETIEELSQRINAFIGLDERGRRHQVPRL